MKIKDSVIEAFKEDSLNLQIKFENLEHQIVENNHRETDQINIIKETILKFKAYRRQYQLMIQKTKLLEFLNV